jgi:hypothetical protein
VRNCHLPTADRSFFTPDPDIVCQGILQAVDNADTLLKAVNYAGPNGKYALTSAQRSLAISLKTQVATYNNNISCP